MLYRRACEGMAGRPHGRGSRKVEWQGTQRSPNLIRIYNQCSWKALMCWIKPKEPTGTSVSAWLSVWFWQRMESLTRHSVWTPSPLPHILTRDCKIDPAIILEAPPAPWISKLNILTASAPKRFETQAFRPFLSTEGRFFEARVNVRSLVTRLTNARPILSPSRPESQCCCFLMTCPWGHFAFSLINIEIRGRVETRSGLSPQKFRPLSG